MRSSPRRATPPGSANCSPGACNADRPGDFLAAAGEVGQEVIDDDIGEGDEIGGVEKDAAVFGKWTPAIAQWTEEFIDGLEADVDGINPTSSALSAPGLMMANIYRTLLREIEADDFQVLHQRTSLTPLRKLWIAWRTARST